MLARIAFPVLAVLAAGTTLKVWTTDLDAKSGSTVTGNARVESMGKDSVNASIMIKGGKANTGYTWGVHSGKCASPGAMLGTQEQYQAIQTDSTGAGSATGTPTGIIAGGKDYSVVLHGDSGASMGACGDLREGQP